MKKPKKSRRDRNESARVRVMGIFNTGTFESSDAAMRAAFTWATSARKAGEKLGRLAVLLDRSEPAAVKATLARRHYWKNIAQQANASATVDVLATSHADDALLLLVVDNDRDSSVVVSLDELKEAHGG